jgi:hypothetical protein
MTLKDVGAGCRGEELQNSDSLPRASSDAAKRMGTVVPKKLSVQGFDCGYASAQPLLAATVSHSQKSILALWSCPQRHCA